MRQQGRAGVAGADTAPDAEDLSGADEFGRGGVVEQFGVEEDEVFAMHEPALEADRIFVS